MFSLYGNQTRIKKMKIVNLFKPKHSLFKTHDFVKSWSFEEKQNFGRLVWLNAVELLTDLCSDVSFTTSATSDLNLFAEFKIFFASTAEQVLYRYFSRGFCVIGYEKNVGFKMLSESEYKTERRGSTLRYVAKNNRLEVYVMRSPLYEEVEVSDREAAKPALELIDNAMNASNTCSARLGTLVVASPSTPNGFPSAVVLTKEQKDDLEKDISHEYGSLSGQKQLMILKRGMNFQTVNLAGVDARTIEKVKLGVCLIADRLKIPANQIALLDANSNKTLANGSELREGDFNKYQTFERLLERTFVQLARDCGLNVDYTIYNKPVTTL